MVITNHMIHKMIQEEKSKNNEFEDLENSLNSSFSGKIQNIRVPQNNDLHKLIGFDIPLVHNHK